MTHSKNLAIEIFAVNTGSSNDVNQHVSSSDIDKSNVESTQDISTTNVYYPQKCECNCPNCDGPHQSVCIKINDSQQRHSTSFIQLPSCIGSFQQQLLAQRLSILPQINELDKKVENLKSQQNFVSFLIANIPAFGILCALISVLCFSFNSVIVKLLKFNYGISGIQVLVTRAIFQVIICGVIAFVKRDSFWGVAGTKINLICRAFTGTISMCCIFTSFNIIPIGDSTTIYSSSPVLVTVLAYFFLNEPFRAHQFVTCLMTIVGVGFISKPEFIFGKTTDSMHFPYRPFGQALAMIAAVTSSITMINLRKLKSTPVEVVLFWFATSIVLFGSAAIYALGTFQTINITDTLCTGLLCAISLMTVTEQYFLTIALQHEDASTISVTRSFNIVLSFLWEVVIFDETVTWTSIVGAALVSGCILLLAFAKICCKMASSPTFAITTDDSKCLAPNGFVGGSGSLPPTTSNIEGQSPLRIARLSFDETNNR